MPPSLVWTATLALGQPRMDETHREFVDLLAQVEAAVDAPLDELQARLDHFVDHTEAHFAQEERWMAAIGFSPENCHSLHHANVLGVLREVRRRLVDEGDAATVKLMVPELAQWFPIHAQSMDAALATTMRQVGFDAQTQTQRRPLPELAEPVTTCGGHLCS